ncbi:MAG: ThuA domain-containing protein [Thermoguttaceae bacterium]
MLLNLFRSVACQLVCCVLGVSCFYHLSDVNMTMAETQGDSAATIRVLFIDGGHGYDEAAMKTLLESFEDVKYKKVTMPAALALLKPGLEKEYDCLVFYDFYTFPYKPEDLEPFKNLLKQGIGCVILHHSVGGYEGSPDYPEMIGGKYITGEEMAISGQSYPRSNWAHDQTIDVEINDASHPILKGIEPFTILDETYGGVYVHPKSHILLSTKHPKSTPQLAWTKEYGKSHVFTTLLGHDAKAFTNPNFQRLIHQAIQWSTKQKDNIQ